MYYMLSYFPAAGIKQAEAGKRVHNTHVSNKRKTIMYADHLSFIHHITLLVGSLEFGIEWHTEITSRNDLEILLNIE